MYRVLLNFAGAINLSIGAFICFVGLIFGGDIDSLFQLIPLIILFGTGGVFLYTANKSNLDKSFSKFVLISAILNIFVCNIISLILGILGYSTFSTKAKHVGEDNVISREKKVLTQEEKEARRMRNILGLGVGLVVLAGIIFATSTWETLSGSLKTIILVCAAILFLLISTLAEKKLNLKVSGMMYYALSNVLVVVSFVSAGYFGVFGEWFSLNGDGSSLFFTVLWVFIGILGYIAYSKYDIKNILYVVYFSLVSVLYFGVFAISDFNGLAFMVISIVIALGAIFSNDNEYFSLFNRFCKVILPIVSFVLFFNIVSNESFIVFYLISFLVCAVSCYYLALISSNEFFKVFAPLTVLANAVGICLVGETSVNVTFLQINIIAILVYAIGFYKREDKLFYNVSAVISNLAWLYVVIDALDFRRYYLAVIASLILLSTSIISSFDKSSSKLNFEKFVEPLKIFILAHCVYKLIGSFEAVKDFSFGVVMSVVFLGMYLIRRDLFKFIYFVICCLTTLFVVLSNLDDFAPVEHISVVLASLILLTTVIFSKESKYVNCKEAIYTVFLLAIGIMFNGFAIQFKELEFACILGTLLSYIVAILFTSNNSMRLITILAVFIPYYWALESFMDLLINDSNFRVVRNMEYIFYSIPLLFMIVIYTRGFLKSVSLNIVKIIEITALSIWYVLVLSRSSAEVALFVGIVALVSILVGYKSEKYVAFYYTGIVFTVLNLLIQLKDMWSIIPIWGYILIAGLVLIGVVTYKEYAKNNPKVDEVVPDVIEPGSTEVKKIPIDTRTVWVGNIIYAFILLFAFINSL